MAGNGNSASERPNNVQRVTITFSPHDLVPHIDMDCQNLAFALVLLEMARLELDARYRFARGRELLVEATEAQASAQLAADLMKKGNLRA
jgi:hypothetical protein